METTTFPDLPPPPMAQPDTSRFAEDSRLHIEFHRLPMLNQFKSQQEGRAIYDEVDHVRIHVPGDKNTVIDAPMDSMYKQRFADRYAKWKAGQNEAVSGTPLNALPHMTPGKVEEYKFFNITTVEQLAEAADGLGQKFMSFQQDKSRAKAFLEVAKGNAPIERMNAELAKRDEEIETLKAQMAALLADKAGKRKVAATEDA